MKVMCACAPTALLPVLQFYCFGNGTVRHDKCMCTLYVPYMPLHYTDVIILII